MRFSWRASSHEQRAFVDWARETAIQLPGLNSETDPKVLAPLAHLLTRKRLVFLGESDHFVHEKYAYRSLLLRWLFSLGFGHVGEELSHSDGRRIDRFLSSGEATWLERVTSYGYRGSVRQDRNDRPTGMLAESFENYPLAAFRSEQLRFARELREVSEGRAAGRERLRLFGLDIDAEPGGAYEDCAEVRDPEFPRVPGESIEQETARLDRVLARLVADHACDPATVQSLRTLRDSLEYVGVTYPASDHETVRRGMAMRERVMYRHVDTVLDQLGTDGKLVLMAHNAHLARTDSGIKNGPRVIGPGGDKVSSLGEHLHARLPGQVFSIWLLHERGHDCQPFPNLPTELRSPPGSLNALLAQVGDAFFLALTTDDPRARLLEQPQLVVGMYNVESRLRLLDQADAIFFVREVSPLRD